MIASVILVVVAGIIALLFHRLSVAAIEQSRLQAASDVALSLATRFAAGVPDKEVLDRVLAEYVHDNSELVAVAVAVDGVGESQVGKQMDAGAALAQARRTSAGTQEIVVADGERLWSVAVPVVRDGETIGTVAVWSSLRASELLSRETGRLAVILLPASIAILVGLLSFVFRREVQRPMEALGAAMTRAESGEPDAEAPILGNDEIGFIAERYNLLLAKQRGSQQERDVLVEKLRNFNEKLSLRVREATAELEERNASLERLNRELYHLQRRLVRLERQSVAEHLTARVAHKIGTPLNLISGHVQLLKQKRGDDDLINDKLDLIEAQIDKLTSTVREILDQTRKTSYEMKPIDLCRLLDNTRSLLEPTLSARGVKMELQLGAHPVEVDADEARLEQVFLTLINNSLDAMPNGGHIEVSAATGASSVVVRVSDDGTGIPEALLPNIFEPFFTTKELGRGTGLGLSIVTEILTAHRAAIRAERREAGGTSFIIELPRPGAEGAA